MKGALQIALVGVGGFLLYEWAQAQGLFGSGTSATPAQPTQPGSTPAGNVADKAATDKAAADAAAAKATANKAAVVASNWTKFADALKAGGYTTDSPLSCDQWNYFYNQVVGAGTAPDPMAGCVAAGQSRSDMTPYATWRAWMTSKGLGRVRRTGYVGHYSAYGRNFGYGYRQ